MTERTPDELVVEEINRRNPYYLNQETQSITSNNVVSLSEEQYIRAIHLQTFATSIRIICIIDASINVIYLYYGYQISYLFFICSFFGYVGTVYYNKCMILLYLMYQYLITFFRTGLLIIYIFLATSSKYRENFKENYPSIKLPENYIEEIIMMSIIFVCQVFINIMVHLFYLTIPSQQTVEYTTYRITDI